MKQLFLVSDQKGMIQAYTTFKEGKIKFDQMCANHIKHLSENPSFNYKRFTIEIDGQKIYQFRSYYRTTIKGKTRLNNDIFSLQTITIE